MIETDFISLLVCETDFAKCTWEPQDEQCDDCGCVPLEIYAQVDYFGETNQYLCTNCLIKYRLRYR
jgi:hypothetical protein